MQLIKQFLLGKLPLWKSFWFFGILGQFTFFFLVSLVLQVLNEQIVLQQIIAVLAFVVGLFIWVGEWRCAFNTKYKFIGVVLRTSLVISALTVAVKFLPYLPGVVVVALISLFILGVFVAIGCRLFTLIRTYADQQALKRQNSAR